jgi:hypothetical protein
MANLFTKEQLDEIASRLIIKSQKCFLIYFNLFLILFLFYSLYKCKKILKINKKEINDLNNRITNIEKKKDNFMSPDDDPRYLVERSQRGVSNKNLLETSGLDFYTNKYIEDSRLLNALNDL